MMKKYVLPLILLMICFAAGAEESGKIDLTINFYQKRIYYLNQSDIFIKIALTNNTAETYRFKAATNKFFNIDFEVKTLSNLILDHSEKFIIERNSLKQVFFREMSLEPGEEYGFVTDLRDFVTFENAGIYSIQAFFYQELLTQPGSVSLESNKLTLSVRPPVVLKEMQAVIEVETGEALQRTSLPPDEVITYMLNARQRSQWEKFFLYIDLETLLLRNPQRSVRYKKLSQSGREEMLNDYRLSLMQDKVEQDILVIPQHFEILETTYTPLNATVIVLEYFDYRDYTEKKRYTYYLKKKDKYWFVVDYTLVSIGTE
ncbi:MAG: hypothetical protein JXJ04_13900 [Spirochaetales bacterium]|nr:hypothetical protein [Spirochaetales bacterium]